MQMYAGAYWSVGEGHRKNQDSLTLQHVRLRKGECLLAVVCDGIGSLPLSEEAGGIAVSLMTDWFYHEGKELIYQNKSKEIILLALQRQFQQIQENLIQFQKNKNIMTGTTFTCIFIIRSRYYFIHIGDSRIYRIRKRKNPFCKQKYSISCLTRDDRAGVRGLHKCTGMSGTDIPVLQTGKVKRQTGILLCTDGFYFGEDAERTASVIGPLLSRDQMQIVRRLELLGEAAVKRGSRDDMSAVCIVVK